MAGALPASWISALRTFSLPKPHQCAGEASGSVTPYVRVVNASATADVCRTCFSSSGVRPGRTPNSTATAPVTCGAAMLVPSITMCTPSGSTRLFGIDALADRAEATPSPGAAISGLSTPSRRGPPLEKRARSPIASCSV